MLDPEGFAAAVEAARRWAIYDPDPSTRGLIDSLLDDADPALADLFTGRLTFGTAGLRAQVGPGPNRMNALVVRQTTTAVVDWLRDRSDAAPAPRIIIGFDARTDSEAFAGHAAAAVNAAGGVAMLASAAGPTPVFAHALLAESADAAVVITASHNPAADNGYKLYLGDGLQLVAPADAEIAERIDRLAASWHDRSIAIDDAWATGEPQRWPVRRWLLGHREAAVAAALRHEREATIVYTPMHGVGGMPVVEAFRAAGFADLMIVEEQFEPDPAFPTVPFPNPEEAGAFDLAMRLAESEGADAAFANDPDADRLAVAVPARDGVGFEALSGNQLGILLADHVLTNTSGSDRLVARSIVSSRQLDVMAEAAGVECVVTLTGFKWVARPIVDRPDRRFVFGFEEAIGYCIGDRVRDKDGVTAAVVAAEMVAGLRARGLTVWQRLDELALVHGLYAGEAVNVRFDDEPGRVRDLMARIQDAPPRSLGATAIVETGPVGFGKLPATSGLHLLGEDASQVIIRPSGTEPKIKAYIEVIELGNDLDTMRVTADERLGAIVSDVGRLLRG